VRWFCVLFVVVLLGFVGVTMPVGGGGLIYSDWDDDYDYAN
jgi:hypothetical protein